MIEALKNIAVVSIFLIALPLFIPYTYLIPKWESWYDSSKVKFYLLAPVMVLGYVFCGFGLLILEELA